MEGPNGLEAVVRTGTPVIVAVCTEEDTATHRVLDDRGMEPVIVTDTVLASASDTAQPQSPVLVIPIPGTGRIRPRNTVVLVDVADPGNVGTIIRSAAAFGWDVAVAGSTADPWSPKALRSSAGTALGVHLASLVDVEQATSDAGLRTAALVTRGGLAPADADRSAPLALMVGSEAHGLPPTMSAAADIRLTIPMEGAVESLNASIAASLAMHALGS